MMRRFAAWLIILFVVAGALFAATPVFAQGWPDYPQLRNHGIDRGPGGYFSWIKLLLIVAVYLVWIKIADRINRDALQFEEHTGQGAYLWNPVVVLSFAAGLIAVLSIPLFAAGFSVYCATAFLPMLAYFMARRGKVPEDARSGELFSRRIEKGSDLIVFKPAGTDADTVQSNLIRARQSNMFEATTALLHAAFSKKTEQLFLDYTRDSVTGREQVDGIWHPLPAMDRASGDAMLVVLKSLADLDPADRRQMQRGRFEGKAGRTRIAFDLQTQGVPTGERALLKLGFEETRKLDLAGLGMSPAMISRLNEALHQPGLVIMSAPAGQGVSTTWHALLGGADRFTRDWVALVDHDEHETEKENIEVVRFDSRAGESPADRLKTVILKQPSVFVVPNPVNARSLDILTDQVQSEKRLLITQARANSAAEALLRVMSMAGNRKAFVKSVTIVFCQRLVRRLCDTCKQPVQANPQAIVQMGGDPAQGNTLYRHYQLPPPEQRIDANGKPVEMVPCKACAGIGFRGRTAIFEMLVVDEAIRKVLLAEPRLETVSKIARQQGNLTLQEQAWRVVLDGRTSLNEVQRVLQGQPDKPSKS
jgi:type II secretory ATPase GspE/PulE/Tfp pilus assembly ATPase PilB-like protein